MSRAEASIAQRQSNQPCKLEDLGSSPSWGIFPFSLMRLQQFFQYIYIYVYIYIFKILRKASVRAETRTYGTDSPSRSKSRELSITPTRIYILYIYIYNLKEVGAVGSSLGTCSCPSGIFSACHVCIYIYGLTLYHTKYACSKNFTPRLPGE